MFGAVVGTFGGIFFGPVGLFVGPFTGALIGELLHGRKSFRGLGRAARIGFGTWLGIVFAVVLALTLAFAMLWLFALVWFFEAMFVGLAPLVPTFRSVATVGGHETPTLRKRGSVAVVDCGLPPQLASPT